jgi:hypothetical protein
MVVLMIEGINKISRSDGFMWHDKRTKFHEDGYRRSSNIKVFPQQYELLHGW